MSEYTENISDITFSLINSYANAQRLLGIAPESLSVDDYLKIRKQATSEFASMIGLSHSLDVLHERNANDINATKMETVTKTSSFGKNSELSSIINTPEATSNNAYENNYNGTIQDEADDINDFLMAIPG